MARTYSTPTVTDLPLVTTAETDTVEVTGITTGRPGKRIRIRGWAQVTAGVGATALTPRIRSGQGVGGALIGEGNPLTIAAGQTQTVVIETEDVPGDVAGQAYTMTMQQTAATGNGTVLQADLTATVED